MRAILATLLVLSLVACSQGETGGVAPGPGGGGGGGTIDTPAPVLEVLSNRADLVSAGDVLVAVTVPAGASASDLTFSARDAAAAALTPVVEGGFESPTRYLARVSGLALGANTLTVTYIGKSDSAAIVNHPNGGPVFSGPQLPNWRCNNGGAPLTCDKAPEYAWFYKSSDPDKGFDPAAIAEEFADDPDVPDLAMGGLFPYDPENPPDDIAMTTPQNGTAMPFIVRREIGYQNRDQYKIFALFDPSKAWTPWAPQAQWNHKLLITHGGSCGTDRSTGNAPTDDYSGTIPANPAVSQSYITALGLGFAVGSTALDNLGHNCNVVTAAESLVMMKEHLVERYGTLRYTMGTGCSGGSITQAMVSNAYPGVYQGNITACAYPDVGSTGAQFADLHLLRGYFEDPSQWDFEAGVVWNPEQMALVEGHISHVNAITTDELFFKSVTTPVGDCGGDDSYSATNRNGVRCGLMDYLINTTGYRDESVWSPMEVAAAAEAETEGKEFKGFAGNPIDNAGIQYGVTVLATGGITIDQFLDLNQKIGGFDIDFGASPDRTVADTPALANAYRSSEINVANNLNRVAIINAFGADPGAAHDTVHAFWVRRRLDREHGNHDNHAMWGGPTPLVGDVNYMNQALVAMDQWLSNVEADTSADPLPVKLTKAKVAAGIGDMCGDGAGHATTVGGEECVTALEEAIAYSSPREVAGAPEQDDILKCQLKPLSRTDSAYGVYGLLMTDAQWAKLNAIFPDGVCDYTKPGVDQQGGVAWLQYGTATTHVFGGQPLPAAPADSGTGVASPAFGVFR